MSGALLRPPAVRPGDAVAVVAPSGPVEPERLRAGLARLSPHLRLRVPDDIGRRSRYLAGSDERRAEELDAALRDPDVRAVVMARGGYGLTRILPLLDPAVLRADPKPLVGFSDGTALLAWAARAGVAGIHGPVVTQLGALPEEDVAGLVRLLTERAPAGRLRWPLSPLGADGAGFTGRLMGGNLTMLAALVGTPWAVELRGAVLLIEEVGEKPYAVDRDLTQLVLAGALDGVTGALVGDLTRCTDPPPAPGAPDDPREALSTVGERLRAARVPGLAGAPIGHGTRNAAVPWGARVVASRDGLELLDAAVA